MHRAVLACKKSVVVSDADILAGHDGRPTLTHDDFTRGNFGTVGSLNAEVFRIGIAEVFRCSASFCMRHRKLFRIASQGILTGCKCVGQAYRNGA